MTKLLKLFSALFFLMGGGLSLLQAQEYKTLVEKIHQHQQEHPVEKVFLHTDKQLYSAGENLWYKAYILNAESKRAEHQSNVLYIELLSENKIGVSRHKTRIVYGGTCGDFQLDKSLPAGNYRLVAYTNLMKNYGEAYYFQQDIQIINPHFEKLDIQYEQAFTESGAIINLQIEGEHFSGEKGTSNYYYRLRNSEEDIDKGKIQFDANGKAILNFDASKITTEDLSLEMAYKIEGETIVREIPLNKKGKGYQLEFYPEGGDMIVGEEGRVAYKLLDEDGNPLHIQGQVIDETGEDVTNFYSLHDGMGIFSIKPEANKSYTFKAEINGLKIEQALPNALVQGMALNLQMRKSPFAILKLSGKGFRGQEFYVLVQDGQNVEQFVRIKWSEDQDSYLMKIAYDKLSSGVKRLTVFDQQLRPHCERLFFVNHDKEEATVQIKTSEEFGNREKVNPKIAILDSLGKPLMGHFSVSVVDKTAVSSEMDHSITSYFLLNSDLENTPQKSVAYLNGAYAENPYYVDMLMLTNGWRRFSWRDVFEGTTETSYEIEKGINLTGSIEGAFGKPQKGAQLILARADNMMDFTMTESDENGNFIFEDLYIQDSVKLVLQGRSKRGKDHVVVKMDTAYHYSTLYPYKKETINEGIDAYISRRNEIHKIDTLYKMGFDVRMLDELVISDTRLVDEDVESMNSSFFGSYNKMLETDEIAHFPTIEMLLQQLVPNARIAYDEETGESSFIYRNEAVGFALDGILVPFNDIKNLLPTNIKQVFFATNTSTMAGSTMIAVHTLTGEGAIGESSLGLNVLTNIGYLSAREFPKIDYSAMRPEHIKPDHRTTVYWEPWVITDKKGKAEFEFYTSDDRDTEYEIRLQGITTEGLFINQSKLIKIK